MSSSSWQEKLNDLADQLSDISLEMAGDEGYCEKGFVTLLSRSMVLAILEVCEDDDRPERLVAAIKSRLDYEMTTAMVLIEKRKH